MRFVFAGLVLIALAVGLSEYTRRHPTHHEGSESAAPVVRPPLLDTDAPAAEPSAAAEAFQKRLEKPADATARSGFTPVVRGDAVARGLEGGFSAVFFVMDDGGGSAIVRAVAGEDAKVVVARHRRIDVMRVDGSTIFFAEGGTVLSTSSRGEEPPQARVTFKRAVVTSLAAVGDTLFLTLMPAEASLSEKSVGAVVRVGSDGQPQLIAGEQARPSGVVSDGKDVFWVSGSSLWRASADGTFSSQVARDVEGPLALDADGVVFRTTSGELKRSGRAGGSASVLAPEGDSFIVSSGLVRYVTQRALFEVVAGGAPTELFAPGGTVRGVALAGTSLYVLVASAPGQATLYGR